MNQRLTESSLPLKDSMARANPPKSICSSGGLSSTATRCFLRNGTLQQPSARLRERLLFSNRPQGYAKGKEAAAPDPDDILADPQHRFRRPLRKTNPSAAECGVHRLGRPVQIGRASCRERV